MACFVFALGVHAFVALFGIAPLGRLERVVVRALGVRKWHGELALQLRRATLGARGNVAAAHECLELAVAGFADEVEQWHDWMGEFFLSIHENRREYDAFRLAM